MFFRYAEDSVDLLQNSGIQFERVRAANDIDNAMNPTETMQYYLCIYYPLNMVNVPAHRVFMGARERFIHPCLQAPQIALSQYFHLGLQ